MSIPHLLATAAGLPEVSLITKIMDEIENTPVNHAAIMLISIILETVSIVLASARVIVNGFERIQRRNKAATTVARFSKRVVTVKTILDTDVFIIDVETDHNCGRIRVMLHWRFLDLPKATLAGALRKIIVVLGTLIHSINQPEIYRPPFDQYPYFC